MEKKQKSSNGLTKLDNKQEIKANDKDQKSSQDTISLNQYLKGHNNPSKISKNERTFDKKIKKQFDLEDSTDDEFESSNKRMLLDRNENMDCGDIERGGRSVHRSNQKIIQEPIVNKDSNIRSSNSHKILKDIRSLKH